MQLAPDGDCGFACIFAEGYLRKEQTMEISVTPQKIGGTLRIIASKSMAHRLLIAAALSEETMEIECNASSEDIDATVRCLTALGGSIERTKDGFSVSHILPGKALEADCGESGSTLRFLLPVIGALGKEVRLKLSGRLPKRPLSPLWEELTAHGMSLQREGENVIVCSGKLRGGAYTLPGNISSQFVSGLLFALPLLDEDSTLSLTGKIESKQYIAMTEEAIRTFGIDFTYKDETYTISGNQKYRYKEEKMLRVEGDWSNAAFWLSAGALGKKVTLSGLRPDSLQGDKEICRILEKFGAKMETEGETVTALPGALSGISIDAAQIPDLVPVLAVVAAGAKGKTHICGAERLRIKESDRLKTVCAMLQTLGGDIEETEDGLIIEGGKPLRGGRVDSAGDHRIAMSAAIASILCQDTVVVEGAQAVNKSYPGFWEHFALMGGKIERGEEK